MEDHAVLDQLHHLAMSDLRDSLVSDPLDCLAKVEDGTHVYVDHRASLQLLRWSKGTPFHRDIDISRDSFVTFFGAPIAAVGWPHADHMHRLSSRVFETGLLQWHERLIEARNVSASRRMRRMRHLSNEDSSVLDDLRVGPLNLLRFAIAFSALLCGCTAAALVAWCERIHRHWTHQRRRRCACASYTGGLAHCLLAHHDDY
ncbi:hypothetical protein MTO96_010100 [Rhipicephalus appendiculatus]